MFLPHRIESRSFYSSIVPSGGRGFEVQSTEGIAFAVGIFGDEFFGINHFDIEVHLWGLWYKIKMIDYSLTKYDFSSPYELESRNMRALLPPSFGHGRALADGSHCQL